MSLEMKSVIVKGLYEAAEKASCQSMIQPGDRIIELGGAIGYIGLFCLLKCKAESVVSVEANPATAAMLRANYRLNGREATVIEAAVVKKEGVIEFNVGADFWADGIANQGEGRKKIQVNGQTLAQILSTVRNNPNVLIADIEGAEAELDWKSLPLTLDRIIIELHPRQYGATVMYRIISAIVNRGFDFVRNDGDVFMFKKSSV